MREPGDKAETFRELHAGAAFVIPIRGTPGRPRAGRARLPALASTSSGFAFTLGRLDGGVRRTRWSHTPRARPGDGPSGLGRPREWLWRRSGARRSRSPVAEAGAVGGSIEDYDPEGPSTRSITRPNGSRPPPRRRAGLDFPFTLTARAENHIRGNPDLDDTIARLQAYEEAGADVLYAPGLAQRRDIRASCDASPRRSTCLRCRASPMRRDRRCGRAAGERGRWADLGRGQGHGRRGAADPRSRTSRRSPRGCRSRSGSAARGCLVTAASPLGELFGGYV